MAIDGKHGSAAYKGGQRENILRTRLQRAIFMVGLTGLFVAAVVVSILR